MKRCKVLLFNLIIALGCAPVTALADVWQRPIDNQTILDLVEMRDLGKAKQKIDELATTPEKRAHLNTLLSSYHLTLYNKKCMHYGSLGSFGCAGVCALGAIFCFCYQKHCNRIASVVVKGLAEKNHRKFLAGVWKAYDRARCAGSEYAENFLEIGRKAFERGPSYSTLRSKTGFVNLDCVILCAIALGGYSLIGGVVMLDYKQKIDYIEVLIEYTS